MTNGVFVPHGSPGVETFAHPIIGRRVDVWCSIGVLGRVDRMFRGGREVESRTALARNSIASRYFEATRHLLLSLGLR
jgi:hypothetical protein